jgi:acyl-CoA reductase-like NAD-dependent aldehyde dehydrogenase
MEIAASINLPLGGVGQPGIAREGSIEGLLYYLESETMLLDRMPSQAATEAR